ncbi:MAG: radical SAM protein [Nitrospinae bacterium]|nr:radical SAM protein [Nitrospinota bacterium]
MSPKFKSSGRLSVCLAYPNVKKVGLSYLGFHKIYAALRDLCDVDFAFLPEKGGRLRSQLQNKPLGNFDVVAFSLTFETDVLNVLSILEGAGIPLERAKRGERHPVVCAGGIAPTLNPEPFADFFDFMVMGEGELTLAQWVEKLANNVGGRGERLAELADVGGVYVPSLYEVEYDGEGRITERRALGRAPETVKRLYDPSFGRSGSAQVIDDETVFKDSWLIETGKGCGQGCRFCAAGFAYRPVRHVSTERLEAQIDEGLKKRKRIGLVGSAICEHPGIKDVYRKIIEKGGGINVSSLRLGYVDREMLELLVKGGLTTMTIAPEAGSQSLRRVINKDFSDEEIVETVATAVSAGMLNVKLYFLVGLPGETEGDVDALVSLVRRIRDGFMEASKPLGRAGRITAAVNPFVPKAQTPYQWEPLFQEKDVKVKLAAVKKGLSRLGNLELKLESGRNALPQAVLSVGSRRAGGMALEAFRDGNWKTAAKNFLRGDACLKGRGRGEILPWDFVDSGVTKEFLWKEREKGLAGKTTPPCPPELSGCRRCGDFPGNCV